jgi:regulator of RNase E activity RraA
MSLTTAVATDENFVESIAYAITCIDATIASCDEALLILDSDGVVSDGIRDDLIQTVNKATKHRASLEALMMREILNDV